MERTAITRNWTDRMNTFSLAISSSERFWRCRWHLFWSESLIIYKPTFCYRTECWAVSEPIRTGPASPSAFFEGNETFFNTPTDWSNQEILLLLSGVWYRVSLTDNDKIVHRLGDCDQTDHQHGLKICSLGCPDMQLYEYYIRLRQGWALQEPPNPGVCHHFSG